MPKDEKVTYQHRRKSGLKVDVRAGSQEDAKYAAQSAAWERVDKKPAQSGS